MRQRCGGRELRASGRRPHSELRLTGSERKATNARQYRRSEGRDVSIFSFGRLVTVLQRPARRAATQPGPDKEGGAGTGGDQLRQPGGAQKFRATTSYHLPAVVR